MPRRRDANHPEYTALFTGVFEGERQQQADYAVSRPSGSRNWLLFATIVGAGRLRTLRGEVKATPGSLVLLAPGQVHDYATAAGSARWGFAWVHLRPPADWLPLLNWPQAAGIRRLDPTSEIFSRVHHLLLDADRHLRGLGRHGRTYAWLRLHEAFLTADEANPQAFPDQREQIRDVLEHIDEHLDRQPTLAELALVSGLSPSRFSHRFTQAMGLPPRRYVLERRLNQAASLLLESDEPVAAIAERLGFANPFHFSTRFRRWSGLSPRAWRQVRSGTASG